MEEITEDTFRQLLSVISEWYDRHGYTDMLKVLYRDLLKNNYELNKATNVMDLMNLLIASGNLHSTYLNLLYDTINITEQYGLEREIKDTLPVFPNVKDVVISKFTYHRRKVMKLGMVLIEEDVKKINGLFNKPLKEYADTWSLIKDLEHRRIICEQKMNAFIDKLNTLNLQHAVEVLKEDIPNASSKSGHQCGEDIHLEIKRKRKHEESEISQPRDPLQCLDDLLKNLKYLKADDMRKFSQKYEEIPKYFDNMGIKLVGVNHGSMLFHLSVLNPNNLENLWEMHISGKLIKDMANLLVTKEHIEAFIKKWETVIEENEYRVVLKRLKERDIFHSNRRRRSLMKPIDENCSDVKTRSDDVSVNEAIAVVESLPRKKSAGYMRRSLIRSQRVGHQKCLTDETGVIKRALRSLCQNDGKLSLEILENKVGQFDPGLGSLEEIISDFHDVYFRIIDSTGGSVIVKAHTQAKICPSYLKKKCEEGDTCQNLHLCGYFATGSCCWFGVNKCRKSHHFRSDHNNQVLKDYDIAFLSHECLKTLFRLAWPEFTVPDFCGLYQSPYGCPDKQACRFLHICKNYVMNECKYRTRCKFSHDILASDSNQRLLECFNISVNVYSSNDIIRLIKERHEGIYRPDVEVLEKDEKDSDGKESDGDTICSSGVYDTEVCTAFEKRVASKNILSFNEEISLLASSGQSEKASRFARDVGHLNNLQTATVKDKREEICQKYLQGRCTRGVLCQKHHCDLPYQWQVQINGKWESVDSFENNAMEKKFCEMKDNETACLDFDTWGRMQIFFDGMFMSSYDFVLNIRRLEVEGKPHTSDANWISHWSWYWKDESGIWIEYAEQNARSDKDSSDFETLYDAYKNRNGYSETVKFKVGNQHYTLNFGTMTQKNDQYGTWNAVCRRPSKYITLTDVEKYRDEKPWCKSNISKYPRTWKMSHRTKSYLLVEVSKHYNREEFQKIQKLFHDMLPGMNVTKIERVQNETLWDLFSRQKEVMMKKDPRKPVDERLLFHVTTPENLQHTCRDNFDCRLSGTGVGAVYGQGTYFSSTSKLSDAYAEADRYGIKKVFVARVLVGSYTTGTRDMCRPPYKNPSDKTKGMYDSCVDNASNPSIFVLFDNHQVYPEYLITYASSRTNYLYSYISSPSFHTSSQTARSTSDPRYINLIRTWDMSDHTKLLVKVSKYSDRVEYEKIQKLFKTTLSGMSITKIERVQNQALWDSFSRQKEVMMMKNPSKTVDERLLFHGTTAENVQGICQENFDFRLSETRVGAVYGQGAYFASTSKYCDSYTEAYRYGMKKMFVARVLVGSYTTGTRDMRRPPYKDLSDKTKGMYDSCVDNASNPSVFVLFDNHQVYPEYLITYTSSSTIHHIGSSQSNTYTFSQTARRISSPSFYSNSVRSNSSGWQRDHSQFSIYPRSGTKLPKIQQKLPKITQASRKCIKIWKNVFFVCIVSLLVAYINSILS